MAFNKNDILAIRTVIDEYACCMVGELADICSLSLEAVFTILKEKLELRQICAHWILHLLSDQQKQEQVRIATELLKIYEHCNDRQLFEIVTGVEMWVTVFEPDRKKTQQNVG